MPTRSSTPTRTSTLKIQKSIVAIMPPAQQTFAWPAQAQRTVAVRAGSMLPQEELNQQQQRLALQIKTNLTMASIQQDFKSRHAKMVATHHQPELSAKYCKDLSRAEDFLRLFVTEVYMPRLYGDNSPFAAEDFLGHPPCCSLAQDRGFWKMIALFVTVRLVPHCFTGKQRRTICTSFREFQALYLAYRRVTGKAVDTQVILECHAVIEENGLEAEMPKPIATYRNMVTFKKDGIFGNQLFLRCPREQVQLAAYNLMIAFCAARPAEVVKWKHKHAGLQYRQLNFYLLLWEDGEEDGQLGGPSRIGADKAAIAANNADNADNADNAKLPQFQLHCNVKIEKLKGHRAGLHKWREQPLYSTGEDICLDPVLLLAHLAELNNAFPAGLTVASMLKDTDPSYFEENDFLPMPFRPEVQDLHVFRTFDKH
ncbi:uncharacterized protein UTRI_01366 [Ustilago trichophora]|uniref:Uncharacterized protein n=1 Tax=Ustilago trichophora TaxID=86804 RepID=A0A5C3DWT8_9BASI|nr:uncharacterized protein UTRI_01366 [Ustilago trichophora]